MRSMKPLGKPAAKIHHHHHSHTKMVAIINNTSSKGHPGSAAATSKISAKLFIFVIPIAILLLFQFCGLALTKERDDLSEEKAALGAKLEQAQDQVMGLTNEMRNLTRHLLTVSSEHGDHSKEKEALRAEAHNQVTTLEAKMQNMTDNLLKVTKERDEFAEEKEILRTEAMEAQSQVKSLMEKMSDMNVQMDQMKISKEGATEQNENGQHKFQQEVARTAEAEYKLKGLEEELKNMADRLLGVKNQRDGLAQEKAALMAQLDEAKDKLTRVVAEKDDETQRVIAERDGCFNVVEDLGKASKAGNNGPPPPRNGPPPPRISKKMKMNHPGNMRKPKH